MKIEKLNMREKGIANYLVDRNKVALNRISRDCVSPLIEIRKAVKADVEKIGGELLSLEGPLTNDEWFKITRWINDAFFK